MRTVLKQVARARAEKASLRGRLWRVMQTSNAKSGVQAINHPPQALAQSLKK